jgi:hypothetical protein
MKQVKSQYLSKLLNLNPLLKNNEATKHLVKIQDFISPQPLHNHALHAQHTSGFHSTLQQIKNKTG